MLSLASASVGFTPAFSAPAAPRANIKMESAAELKGLATKLNPSACSPRDFPDAAFADVEWHIRKRC